jgi:serine protease Do
VQVTSVDGKTYTAKVICTDSLADLALIKIDGKDFLYVKLTDITPRIGDWVLAVGNPFGLGETVLPVSSPRWAGTSAQARMMTLSRSMRR